MNEQRAACFLATFKRLDSQTHDILQGVIDYPDHTNGLFLQCHSHALFMRKIGSTQLWGNSMNDHFDYYNNQHCHPSLLQLVAKLKAISLKVTSHFYCRKQSFLFSKTVNINTQYNFSGHHAVSPPSHFSHIIIIRFFASSYIFACFYFLCLKIVILFTRTGLPTS